MIDDEKFFAWLDGELDPAEAAEVAAAVAADAYLARMADQHRSFDTRLRATFDTVAVAPVPDHLASAVKPQGAKVVDFLARRSRRNWTPLSQWAAIAATLVIGVFVGTRIDGKGGTSPVEVRGGQMIAAAALDGALDRQLASAGGTGTVRIGVTFRDEAGVVCRSFIGQGSSGLACRDGEDWVIRGLFAAPQSQDGDYRMAAGADQNVAALIDSTIRGDAFDAVQERSARDGGWR